MVTDYPDYWKPIAWVEQYGDLWPIRDWAARMGYLKFFRERVLLWAGEATTQVLYVIPEGKRLSLDTFAHSTEVLGETFVRFYPGPRLFHIYCNRRTYQDGTFGTSVIGDYGQELQVRFDNDDTISGGMSVMISGFEIPASSPEPKKAKTASDRYKQGLWNYVDIERDPEGLTLYEFGSSKEAKVFRFKAKNLYTAEEEILEDEEV